MSDASITDESHDSDWAKFKLLLWKNYMVHLANWRAFCLIALIPAMFCTIFVIIRCMIMVDIEPANTTVHGFTAFSWHNLIALLEERHLFIKNKLGKDIYNVYIPRKIIAYAPSKYEAFNNIMQSAHTELEDIELLAFDACAELRETMQKEFYFAGVCFDDSVMSIATESIHLVDSYPNHLIFSIVFPSELRIYNDSYLSNHWKTGDLFYSKRREVAYKFGSRANAFLMSYIREGFIAIQYSISKAYIHLISKSTNVPRVIVLPFPTREHRHDNLSTRITLSLPLMVVASFIGPTIYFLKDMYVEKQKIKEKLLTITCVRPRTQYLAWVVASCCGLAIASLILVVQLKIHWQDGYGILTHSSILILFLFLISYNMSSICFSYLTAKCFSRPSTGACVLALFWILTYLPFLMLVRYRHLDLVLLQWFAYLFPNSVLGLGFRTILDLEAFGYGLNWSSLLKKEYSYYKISVGASIFIFFVQTIFYMCIALFLSERKCSKWCIEKLYEYLKGKRAPRKSSYVGNVVFKTKVYEVEPSYKRILVEFKNVSKEYDGKMVLNDISFNLYEDDCTVLMGHNGAGKSMLMSIAIGLTEPTSGSVIIKRQDLGPARRRTTSLGVCISDHLIFNELTVSNQLLLFSRLRGKSVEAAQAEVLEYLKAMELEDKRDVLTRNLSRGTRQHLAVCTALIGDTKVVILDEPTSKIDLSTRKLIWKLLNREKIGRAILVITQSTEEAEILADRLTIISRGVLKCHGSTFFLRSVFGHGFRLILYKGPNCSSDQVTELFRKYIPNISPACDFYAELSYIIEGKYQDILVPLFKELIEKTKVLNIETFAFSEVTMEDIFFDMGAEHPSDGNRHRHKQILNGESIYKNADNNFLFLEDPPQDKCRLLLSQWYAMFYKRIRFLMFYKMDLAICLIFFAICTTATFTVAKGALKNLQPIRFKVNQLQKTSIIFESRTIEDPLFNPIEEQARQLIFWAQANQIELTSGMDMLSFLTWRQKEDVFFMSRKVLVGISFQQTSIIAWFNSYAMHSAPLSLNMVYNAILRALLNSHAEIVVTLDPLPLLASSQMTVPQTHLTVGHFLGMNLATCLCYLASLGIIFLVKEQRSRCKLLELIAGASLWTFWMSTFFFDFLIILGIATIPTIMVLCSNDAVFRLPFVTGSFFLLFILTGLAIISINYAFSMHFKDYHSAYLAATSVHAFGYVSIYAYHSVFAIRFLEPASISPSLEWIMRMFPLFSFGTAFTNIYTIGMTHIMCNEETLSFISIELENCNCTPHCCQQNMSHIHKRILLEYIYLVSVIVITWLIIICCENSFRFRCCGAKKMHAISTFNFYQVLHGLVPHTEVSDDVYREFVLVNTESRYHLRREAVIYKNVYKLVHGVPIVNGVSFFLQPSDCFGLFGPNGSGKSTLLKMIVGHRALSRGDVFINNTSLSTNPRNAFKYVGFSSSIDNMNTEFTCFEVLKIFCLLRGIERHKIPAVCEDLAKLLGFFTHYHKQLINCSEGTAMRINCAIAIVKTPAVLCLDMPMAHVDVVGRRQLWNVINELRQRNGTTVMFSSLFTREFQRYCSKMAIMNNGRLHSIGTPFELAKKHPEGYIIYLKMKSITKDQLFLKTFLKLTTFMEQQFPTSQLLDYYCNMLIFFIPLAGSDITLIFDVIPNSLYNLNLETFRVSRETLAFAYLNAIENQKKVFKEAMANFM